jgi:uncharacterized protein YndB with AHSA1/START domain
MTEDTDRIEKQILIRAPRGRVWRALSDPGEFGRWFGAAIEEGASFVPGARLSGKITSPGYEHVLLELTVERVEAERLISWRWHPYAVEAGRDYSGEPTTLVVFELRDAPEGTLLTVAESGFDALPVSRRAEARRMNDGGWASQIKNVERHVTGAR